MKIPFTKFLIASVMIFGIAAQAHAQTSAPALSQQTPPYNTKGNQPCASEHANVVAQCQKGDPCGAACKQARQAMKQCRIANNLPTKPHTGATHKPSPCKTPSSSNAPSGNTMQPPVAAPQNP